jgi:hypothetical protein
MSHDIGQGPQVERLEHGGAVLVTEKRPDVVLEAKRLG